MTQRGIPTDELRAEHARGIPNAFDRLEQLLPGPTDEPRYGRTTAA